MKGYIACLSGLALLVFSMGCGRSERPEAAIADVEPHAEVDRAISELEQVQMASGTEAMLMEGLEKLAAMTDEEQQRGLLHWLVRQMDLEEGVEPMLVFFSALVAEKEELALAALPALEPVMMEQVPEQWLAILLDPEAPLAVRARGHHAWVRAYGASIPIDVLDSQLDAIMDPEMMAYAPQLFQDLIREVSGHEDPAHVAGVLALLAERGEGHAGLLLPVRMGQAHVLVQQEAWAEAFEHVRMHQDLLGDRNVAHLLVQLMRASANQDPELVEQVTAWGYAQDPELPLTRERFARWHMDQLRESPDVDRLVAVMTRALGHGVAARSLAAPFLWGHFYPVMAEADDAGKRKLQALLFRVRSEVGADTPASIQTGLDTAALDSCFFLEDFAQALEIVDTGIEGYDSDWHLEVREKIEAHLALQEGRPEDAIERFERHIERVRAWSEAVVAPDTGRKIVSDEVIALNERRIGDIRATMEGGEAASAAAYERAARHYRAALEAYHDEVASREIVLQALDSLPAPPAGLIDDAAEAP